MIKTMTKAFIAFPILMLLCSASARADSLLMDPVGDFLPTYAGPHNGDLDVVGTNVSLVGTNLSSQRSSMLRSVRRARVLHLGRQSRWRNGRLLLLSACRTRV
jgi:hypothetical protein